jgi:hypothetical protein
MQVLYKEINRNLNEKKIIQKNYSACRFPRGARRERILVYIKFLFCCVVCYDI